ncbi:hypothetical protein [Candidatus Burkholderia verschuerenii]|uniref:hypothetical protein n=1 Tax=Candidatus Burkholderia verschuerenii TaxID=242163 RepID=UPI000A802701|nr:hypothetical protein [Candidatus Burkholderia verschuerenii]
MPIQQRAIAPGLLRVAAAAALVAVSVGASAANLGFLNNTPITYMKQRDLQALNDAAQTALNTKQDGEAMDWSNKGAGNTVPINGTITPHDSFRGARDEVPQDHARRERERADSNLDAVRVQA